MGKIGFGYGSEWQLLRMLGRHREYFNRLVLDSFQLEKSTIEWYDFKFHGSKDSELKGEDIFENLGLNRIHPNILNKTSWDIVGKLDAYILLGEAKGHISEFLNKDKTGASENSIKEYTHLLEEILKYYEIDLSYLPNWINKAYQLGNRIVMQYYLSSYNIQSYVLYIFFLNDWRYNYYTDSKFVNDKSVSKVDSYVIAFDDKLELLGFKSSSQKEIVKEKIKIIYPDCQYNKK